MSHFTVCVRVPDSLVAEKGSIEAAIESLMAPYQENNMVSDNDNRSSWHDVYKAVTKEEFLRDYLITFNPIKTFAVLDEAGWHEAGKMGWFGMSSDTPDSYLKQAQEFPAWLRATPPDASLVVLDCHT